MEYQKVKSAAKRLVHKGETLDKIVLETMSEISQIVGSTLGPGGRPVMIERFEHNFPVTITKDGVTVFAAIGFDDPVKQCVMESARDAAKRTASEAGDGTTTATIMAHSFVSLTQKFLKSNPDVSPISVVSGLQNIFNEYVEPTILQMVKHDADLDKGRDKLLAVATVSANGDTAMAKAVLEAFDLCGDKGNIQITEATGDVGYHVTHVKGYPIPIGYEESCGRYGARFVNRPDNQTCTLENPIFVLYADKITETQRIIPIMQKIGQEWEKSGGTFPHNVVLVAAGFSETVLVDLATNFRVSNTINVFPLQIPQKSPETNAAQNFIDDLAAITNSTVYSALGRPIEKAELLELGNLAFDSEAGEWKTQGVTLFECSRYRSNVIGHADDVALLERISELESAAKNPESRLDAIILKERIGKLSGGIARLTVTAPSDGSIKERRDRADDAICAVRSTLLHGYLLGGGRSLYDTVKIVSQKIEKDSFLGKLFFKIMAPTLLAPIDRLIANAGASDWLKNTNVTMDDGYVMDLAQRKMVKDTETTVFDSAKATLEAIKNALSISTLLGTLGGVVVFNRNYDLELSEAQNTQTFMRQLEGKDQ